MPIIKSQERRLRKSRKQAERNRAVKSEIRTYLRKFYDACESGDKDIAADEYKRATRVLDKAVSKGIVHRNNAANKKSKMAQRLNAL